MRRKRQRPEWAIRLTCPNGHAFDYTGILGSVAGSNVRMITGCPRCGADVTLTISPRDCICHDAVRPDCRLHGA